MNRTTTEGTPAMHTARYRVAQSDCRTGWMVLDAAGRVASCIYRRRGPALEHCAELNGQLKRDADHVDRFYANQAREFIARTR